MIKDSDYPYPDDKGRWTYQGKVHRCLPKAFARRFLKKKIIVVIKYLDQELNEVEKRQYWGRIASVHPRRGIVVTNPNTGERFSLPPDLACLDPVKEREYKLKPAGEIVTNPAYITRWTSSTIPEKDWTGFWKERSGQ